MAPLAWRPHGHTRDSPPNDSYSLARNLNLPPPAATFLGKCNNLHILAAVLFFCAQNGRGPQPKEPFLEAPMVVAQNWYNMLALNQPPRISQHSSNVRSLPFSSYSGILHGIFLPTGMSKNCGQGLASPLLSHTFQHLTLATYMASISLLFYHNLLGWISHMFTSAQVSNGLLCIGASNDILAIGLGFFFPCLLICQVDLPLGEAQREHL